MKLLKTLMAAVAADTNGSDLNIVKADLTKVFAREFMLAGKITSDASGAGTITVTWAFSDDGVALTAAGVAKLSDREANAGAITVTASHDKQYRFTGRNSTTNPLRKEAKFLYVWFDRASQAGATKLTVDLRRLPSTDQDGFA